MSTAPAGTFTCNVLQTAIRKATDVYNPADPNPDYTADVVPAKLVVENQKAKFPDLTDPRKDRTISIVYTNKCGVEVTDNTDLTQTCDIDGTEAGSLCEDFLLDFRKESPGWKVSELKFRALGDTLTWEEELAINIAADKRAMDQLVSNYLMGKIEAAAGVNLNTSPYSVSGVETTIPAAAWNADLFGYLRATINRNKFGNMIGLFGGLMETQLWKINMETTDPTGASAARKAGTLKYYQDSFVVEDVVGEKAAYLIDPNVLGFASKAYYTPFEAGKERVAAGNKQILTTVRSEQIPGVVYDMILQESCVNGDTITTGKLFFTGGFHLNPNRCRVEQTGVLKFVCG